MDCYGLSRRVAGRSSSAQNIIKKNRSIYLERSSPRTTTRLWRTICLGRDLRVHCHSHLGRTSRWRRLPCAWWCWSDQLFPSTRVQKEHIPFTHSFKLVRRPEQENVRTLLAVICSRADLVNRDTLSRPAHRVSTHNLGSIDKRTATATILRLRCHGIHRHL